MGQEGGLSRYGPLFCSRCAIRRLWRCQKVSPARNGAGGGAGLGAGSLWHGWLRRHGVQFLPSAGLAGRGGAWRHTACGLLPSSGVGVWGAFNAWHPPSLGWLARGSQEGMCLHCPPCAAGRQGHGIKAQHPSTAPPPPQQEPTEEAVPAPSGSLPS
jgi:hypothetical protein